MLYSDVENRKKKVRKFLRKYPTSTFRDIKRLLHTKINKVYLGGMKEAFEDAGIKPPRTFRRKTKEENRKIVADYIKKHPGVGGHIIAKNIKINPSNVFQNMKEAYDLADVEYPRTYFLKSREEKEREIISLVKNNPLISAKEIKEITNINPFKIFKNFNEIYLKSNIKKINARDKIGIKKRLMVINYIKKNQYATQRDINKNCKTHVQTLFNKGIFEAYKNSGVPFPYERLKLYGIGIKKVREEAKEFEKEISLILSGYGKVNRLVKTKRGIADIIFERGDKKAIIEVKNYKLKEISQSQVNQLNMYLEDCNCEIGFLICHEKPKKDRFLIGQNKLFILTKDELKKIPYLMKEL